MRLAGYQPQYFPRLHYFNRVLDSDIFEVSDYVQFVQRHAFPQADGSMKRDKSFQAHSPIKLSNGVYFLTIPTKDEMLPINQTKISYASNWAEKQLRSLEVAYAKAPNFSRFFPELKEIIGKEHESLGELTLLSTLWGIARVTTDEKISIEDLSVEKVNTLLRENTEIRLKRVFLASESGIPVPRKGEANEWIIKLCEYAGANEYYYGGTSHSAYMDLEKLKKAGITSIIQDWNCAPYTQQYMKIGFLPNLSIIDLVMNTDLETRQKILL